MGRCQELEGHYSSFTRPRNASSLLSAMGGDMTPDVDLCRRCGIHGMVFRARLLSSLPET
jgi:hypothetical protein